MSQEKITATEFARRKGRTEAWTRWFLKKARKEGLQLPEKVGNYWLATEEEWEKLLKSLNIKPRK